MQVLITRHDSSYEQRDFTRQLLKTPIVDQRIEDDWTQFMMGDCEVVLPYTDENWAFFYPNEAPPEKLSLDFRVSGKTVFKGVNYIGAARDLKSDTITVQFLEVLKELEGMDFTIPAWTSDDPFYLKFQDSLQAIAEANNVQLNLVTNWKFRRRSGQFYQFSDLYVEKSYYQTEGLTFLQVIKDVALGFGMIFWLDYGQPVQAPPGNIVELDTIAMRDRGVAFGSFRQINGELLEANTEGREHPTGVIVRAEGNWESARGDPSNAFEIELGSLPKKLWVKLDNSYVGAVMYMVSATATYYYRWMIRNKFEYLRAKLLGTDFDVMDWLGIPALNSRDTFFVNAMKTDYVKGVTEVEGELMI